MVRWYDPGLLADTGLYVGLSTMLGSMIDTRRFYRSKGRKVTASSGNIAILAAGGLIGGTVFGIYLLVSLNLFRIHENEAFSSLRIPHHKHFLRFHLTREGLRLFVIAVDMTAPEGGEHPVPLTILERRTTGSA